MRQASTLRALDIARQEQLRTIIGQLGEREASERFALHKVTLLAAASGRPLRRSSLRLVEVGLAQFEARPC
jgi:hypothetical protein